MRPLVREFMIALLSFQCSTSHPLSPYLPQYILRLNEWRAERRQ